MYILIHATKNETINKYIYIYTHTHIYIYIYIYICGCSTIHDCVNITIHECKVCIDTYVCIYILYLIVHVRVCVCACLYTVIYTRRDHDGHQMWQPAFQ